MKKNLLITLIAFFSISFYSKACIKPDSVVWINVNFSAGFDTSCTQSENVNEVELRLTNLRLMNESPNKICACALASYSDLFEELLFIAFVDSGTNNPYQGFQHFTEALASSSAWENSSPGNGEWTGLIADVINSGLIATDPVELVIRFKAPRSTGFPGDTLFCDNSIDELLAQSSIGTDEWDPIEQDIKQDHKSIKSLDPKRPGNQVSYSIRSAPYFEQLDTAILNNVTMGVFVAERVKKTSIFPNPNRGETSVSMFVKSGENINISLIDVSGKNLETLVNTSSLSGDQNFKFDLKKYAQNSSVAFLRIERDDHVEMKKVLFIQ